MKSSGSDTFPPNSHDKQLHDISVEVVLEKRRLGQALNAKEFAVCAGVSYSTARSWFHLPGFPVFHGFVFWQDFVDWRTSRIGLVEPPEVPPTDRHDVGAGVLPPRAARILLETR